MNGSQGIYHDKCFTIFFSLKGTLTLSVELMQKRQLRISGLDTF